MSPWHVMCGLPVVASLAGVAVVTAVTVGGLASCGTSSGDGSSGGASGSTSSGSTSGGSSAGSSGSSTGSGSTSGGSSTGSSGSNPGSGSSSGVASTGSNGGSGSSGSSTGSSSGSGSSGSPSAADAGSCANTNTSQINIDSSGWICNNKWGIQGAWYCYNDPQEASPSCKGTGDIPYVASKGMCLSGSTAVGSVFGAGLGFVLAQPDPKSTAKPNYNAQAQNIIGFAVTLTGTSGGSALNIGFPGSATNANGDSPFVTVPGVNNTTITYNALFADARTTNPSPIVVPEPRVDPTKVTDVKIVIPDDKSVHNYNFCVTSVVPITAPPSSTPSCTTQYGPVWDNGKQLVVSGFGNVAVQNDPFDAAHHVAVTTFGGGDCVGFTATASWGGGAVAAFPSLVYGYALGGNNDGNFYGGYAGGKTIGTITSAMTSWTWSGTASQYDAAYDVWFADNQNPKNPGTELMVWLGRGNNQPLGQDSGAKLSAWGTTFSVFTGGQNQNPMPPNQPVVSYVASSTMNKITNQDLEPIFKDAAMRGYAGLKPGSFLLGIQAGFEMYSGSFTTSSYSVNVQ